MQGGEGLASIAKKRDQFKYAVEQSVAYAECCQPLAINILAGRCFDPKKPPLSFLKGGDFTASRYLNGLIIVN